MDNKFTRRGVMKLLASAFAAGSLPITAQAQYTPPIDNLEGRIKAQISLGYKLISAANDHNFAMGGAVRGCDPLLPVAETISHSMLIGETYHIKLIGTIVGLDEATRVSFDDIEVEIGDFEMRRGVTTQDIYELLDNEIDQMASQWASQARENQGLINALRKPKYPMITNCALS
ncbi:MAG: hypothetical protein AAF988_04525 [Pseudomonadota bacterium]